MIARMCPVCGVIKITPGRCTICARPGNTRKAQRANHAAVYNTTRWRKLRAYVLERDGGICAECGGDANTVDHIEPFTGADDPYAWDTTNLQVLCATHHGRKDATRGAALYG